MIRIFIETKTNELKQTNEEQFVRHIIKLLGYSGEFEIIGTDGYTNLVQFSNAMKRNTSENGTNIVIFDADYPETGGFAKRKAELETLKTTHTIAFELFLYPNNQDNGIFENLLETLITTDHKCLLECFHSYQDCIRKNNTKSFYKLPMQKAKLYTYLDTLSKSKAENESFKKGNCFFENENYWNFNTLTIEPLMIFLKKYL